MQVIILSGIPGSGKSTYQQKNYPDAIVCSADNFFMVNDVYKFDANKLSEAHAYCMRKFISALNNASDYDVIVDNTNVTALDMAPYVTVAKAFDRHVTHVIVTCDVKTAFSRCFHGVSEKSIARMADSLQRFKSNGKLRGVDLLVEVDNSSNESIINQLHKLGMGE